MDQDGIAVTAYRWMTLLLALGFLLYQLLRADYASFGGPFRFLAIWALCLSCASALAMLCVSLDATERRWHGLATVTALLNVMVVFLYWRLFRIDPGLVNGEAGLPPMLDHYLHAVGPGLQIADALFLGQVFRRVLRAVPALLLVIGAYVAWTEGVLRGANDMPVGRVTSGLPYPFLNDMTGAERLVYYLVNTGLALAALAGLTALGWAIRRGFPRG